MGKQRSDDKEANPCERLKKIIKDLTFYEGEYLDYWSVIHFSSGFILGLLLNWIGFSILEAFFITAFILTFWEVVEPDLYEMLRKFFPTLPPFGETKSNTLIDILVGMLGFILAKLLDTLINYVAMGELKADFTLEQPNALMVLRAVFLLLSLTVIFVPLKVVFQQRNKRRPPANKTQSKNAFKEKVDALIERVRGSGLTDEQKRRIIDELKRAKKKIDDDDFSEANGLLKGIIDGLPEEGTREIRRELTILELWALLMNVKANWTPGNDDMGVKSFSAERNEAANECFIVLVLVIPKIGSYGEPGDEEIQSWRFTKKVRRRIKIPCENLERARRMLADATVKLNDCEWPGAQDAENFGGLLTPPANPPGEGGGSGEF